MKGRGGMRYHGSSGGHRLTSLTQSVLIFFKETKRYSLGLLKHFKSDVSKLIEQNFLLREKKMFCSNLMKTNAEMEILIFIQINKFSRNTTSLK